MWLWSLLTGADHRELTAPSTGWSTTHSARAWREGENIQLYKHTQDDRGVFNQAQAIACYEAAFLPGSSDASVLPTAQSFSAESYWACYSPVMNPVARLAWLRFLLHIPGRCQGPHRRQRSLPKSQPCYTDECVCPVLWSKRSAYVFFVPLLLWMFLCVPLHVDPPTHPHPLWVSCLCLEMRLEANVLGKVQVVSSSTPGGPHAGVNRHSPRPVVTLTGLLSTSSSWSFSIHCLHRSSIIYNPHQ